MTEKPDYFHEHNRTIHLRVWALGQMVWGAFLAGVVVLGIGVTLLVIWALGLLLPEESKQAPSPYSAIEIAAPADRGLA